MAATPNPTLKSDLPGGHIELDRMPGHWVLARLGKRVLRPGGIKMTRQLLKALQIGPADDVVEFAPGLGATARMTLSTQPASYTAVERDEAAGQRLRRYLHGANQRCILGTAEDTGLESACASVVYGEAMLTMQTKEQKRRIVAEAARLLKSGGRYGMHEICLVPDDISAEDIAAIAKDLAQAIQAGARPLRPTEWRELVEAYGMEVVQEQTRAFALLQPVRVVQDEGVLGALRFGLNVLRDKPARQRVLAMRRAIGRHAHHLMAYMLVAVKRD
ncbi:MAG: class I SAM-dependent methyltransferase [Planctomycetes bacterium]|nr:class I SAM-dependent methyltransferase [Planctomycetota bacterium]